VSRLRLPLSNPARRKIRRRPIGRDREHQLDLADIGGQAGAATHAVNIAPAAGKPKGRPVEAKVSGIWCGWQLSHNFEAMAPTDTALGDAIAALKPTGSTGRNLPVFSQRYIRIAQDWVTVRGFPPGPPGSIRVGMRAVGLIFK
jgi:hypothetical protein